MKNFPLQHRFKTALVSSFICAGILCSGSAFAASFDFAARADNTGGLPNGTGESAWNNATPYSWTVDGITVTATARNLANTQERFVYADSNNAGLGVCTTLNGGASTGATMSTSNLCNPSNDDNITQFDVLDLVFDQKVIIDALTLVNGSHGTSFTGDFGVAVDFAGTPTDAMLHFTHLLTQNNVVNPGVLTGTNFSFISNTSISGHTGNSRQLYINALEANPVPEPSTMLLLGSGLIGLIAWRKKK